MSPFYTIEFKDVLKKFGVVCLELDSTKFRLGWLTYECEYNEIFLTDHFWAVIHSIRMAGLIYEIRFYKGGVLYGLNDTPSKDLKKVIQGRWYRTKAVVSWFREWLVGCPFKRP